MIRFADVKELEAMFEAAPEGTHEIVLTLERMPCGVGVKEQFMSAEGVLLRQDYSAYVNEESVTLGADTGKAG